MTERLWNKYDYLMQIAGGTSQAFAESVEDGEGTGTERMHRGIPLRLAEKYTSW